MRITRFRGLHGLAFPCAIALAALAALCLAPSARAAASCSFDAGTATVSVGIPDGDTATMDVGGSAIRFGGAQCGTATVTNTDTIQVTGDAGQQGLVISLAGGLFEPGATAEGSGTSEIEWLVDLGDGADSLEIVGGSGADVLQAGTNGVSLSGDFDLDVATASVEALTLSGGDGGDQLSAHGGAAGTGGPWPLAVQLDGAAGDDFLYGGDGGDTLSGGDGSDWLYGRAGNDTLSGGAGDDYFVEDDAANGADVFNGGDGTDLVDYGYRSSSVTVTTSDGGANDGEAGEGDLVRADVENVRGGSGDDVISGGSGPNRLNGGAGDDQLSGGGGDDSFCGEEGDDSLYGGAGADLFEEGSGACGDGSDTINGGGDWDDVYYDGRSNPLTVTTGDGLANDGEVGEGDLVRADVEGVHGGSGNDVITGGPGANNLQGGPGDDTLYGGGGDDIIGGDSGNDTLYGGPGADTFEEYNLASGSDVMSGGAGLDTVDYESRSNAVAVTLGDGLANDGESGEGDLVRVDVENVMTGSGNDTIVGSAVANQLSGSLGDDTISGGGGDDLLAGETGNDTLYGGPGDDILYQNPAPDGSDILNGGTGADTVSYQYRSTAVTVTLADGLANDGGAGENDLVRSDVENVTGGYADDTITGSSAANVLRGNDGNDTIYAGAGNDTLYGDAGSDSLFGGDGDDYLYAQDGEGDYLNGGNGTDNAAWDVALDTLVAMEVA